MKACLISRISIKHQSFQLSLDPFTISATVNSYIILVFNRCERALPEQVPGRPPDHGGDGEREPDGEEGEDEEEGVDAVEEPVRHELLQLAGDLHERVHLLAPAHVALRVLWDCPEFIS